MVQARKKATHRGFGAFGAPFLLTKKKSTKKHSPEEDEANDEVNNQNTTIVKGFVVAPPAFHLDDGDASSVVDSLEVDLAESMWDYTSRPDILKE
jgi:hypothetical protein